MSEIVWDDSYSVGNDALDEQHKKWISIYNNIHSVMIEGDVAERNAIGEKIVKEMLDYTRDHFKFEEEYMRSIGFPDLSEHYRKHKDFDNEVYALYREIQKGDFVFNTEIISLIRNWLQEHILEEDRMYARYLEQKRSNNITKVDFTEKARS